MRGYVCVCVCDEEEDVKSGRRFEGGCGGRRGAFSVVRRPREGMEGVCG